jgi:hypothetical protein
VGLPLDGVPADAPGYHWMVWDAGRVDLAGAAPAGRAGIADGAGQRRA